MDWRKVWVVARHEFLTNVRRAGFIIMTLIIPVLGILTLLIGALFAGPAAVYAADGDTARQRFYEFSGTLVISLEVPPRV